MNMGRQPRRVYVIIRPNTKMHPDAYSLEIRVIQPHTRYVSSVNSMCTKIEVTHEREVLRCYGGINYSWMNVQATETHFLIFRPEADIHVWSGFSIHPSYLEVVDIQGIGYTFSHHLPCMSESLVVRGKYYVNLFTYLSEPIWVYL